MSGPFTATIIGATLGMLGSILMIFFSFFVSRRLFYLKPHVNFLSLLDLLSSIGLVIPIETQGRSCTFQTCWIVFFSPAAIAFSATISVLVLIQAIWRTPIKKLNRIVMPIGIVLMLVTSATLSITVGVSNKTAPNKKTSWCWLTEDDLNQFFYLVLWCYLAICLITSIALITYFLKNRSQYFIDANYKRYLVRWILFPSLLCLINLPATINRAAFLIQGSKNFDSKVLNNIQALLTPTQGLIDLILFYLYPKEIRNSVLEGLKLRKRNDHYDVLLISHAPSDED
ncbi:g protein-coupled receptor [Anaeramoeba flamelloides]|uniref:G protein-coupled receptor n=1 Tax=Anaeramoeba flamelloides TaxID=1746091 RepID=A0AAV7Y324_9EUKA|nr:g protein-coupled receptor [Anaeramoeba flamelloides]KAJ6229469.1 g protein-coupled receptor [Anaeramoeba flamelloides]